MVRLPVRRSGSVLGFRGKPRPNGVDPRHASLRRLDQVLLRELEALRYALAGLLQWALHGINVLVTRPAGRYRREQPRENVPAPVAGRQRRHGVPRCAAGTNIARRSMPSGVLASLARRWWRRCIDKLAAPAIAAAASATASEPIARASTARPAQAAITAAFTTATMPAVVSVSCQAPGRSDLCCNKASACGPRTTSRNGSSSGATSR